MNSLASIIRRLYIGLEAIGYFLCHPFDITHLTIVRRYVDAQGHYIGELYDGDSRDAKMIGMSCDSWPLNADITSLPPSPRICWRLSFLDPLPANTLRVGAMEPRDNAKVQEYLAIRRYSIIRVVVLNRFVEHVMGITE